MSRKDYSLVAIAICEQRAIEISARWPGKHAVVATLDTLARKMAERFKQDNEDFNVDIFLCACGVAARSPAVRDQELVRYYVDGHEFANDESNMAGDGKYPPFRIFDALKQVNLPGEYKTRNDAEAIAVMLRSGLLADKPTVDQLEAALRRLPADKYNVEKANMLAAAVKGGYQPAMLEAIGRVDHSSTGG